MTVDTNGHLRWKADSISFFPEHGDLGLIIIVTESTPQEYLNYLRNLGISYVIGGKETVDFSVVLQKLAENFQIKQILLEGGAKINGSFAAQQRIDEIYLLLLPRILNKSDAPAVFENDENTKAAFSQLDLVESKEMERGSVLLHYRKK